MESICTLAAARLAMGSTPPAPALAYTSHQTGYADGATVSGHFVGNDLNGDGWVLATKCTTTCRAINCHNALDVLLGCVGGIALIATALSAFFPDKAKDVRPTAVVTVEQARPCDFLVASCWTNLAPKARRTTLNSPPAPAKARFDKACPLLSASAA